MKWFGRNDHDLMTIIKNKFEVSAELGQMTVLSGRELRALQTNAAIRKEVDAILNVTLKKKANVPFLEFDHQ